MNKEKIEFVSCIALVVCACMGNVALSLFLVSPKIPVVGWVIASIVCYCYSLIVFEFVNKYPEHGGIYLFPKRLLGARYGTIFGFLCGWGYIVSSVLLVSIIGNISCLESPIIILLSSVVLLFSIRVHKILQNIFLAGVLCYCSYLLLFGKYHMVEGSDNLFSSWPLILFAYCGSLSLPFFAHTTKLNFRLLKLSFCIGLIVLVLLSLGVLYLNYSMLFVLPAIFIIIIVTLKMSAKIMQAMSIDGFFSDMFSREKNTVLVMVAVSLLLSMFIGLDSRFFLLTVTLALFSFAFVPLSFFVLQSASRTMHIISAFVAIVFFLSLFSVIYLGGWLLMADMFLIFLFGLLFYLPGYKNTRKRFSGIVVHGKGRGHIFDIPTANIELFEGQGMPNPGVWRVKVFLRGKIYDGVTNVGLRPTDDVSDIPTIETMLLNFSDSIYGEKMTIEIMNFIRETKQFSNMDELKKQIQEDISSCI